MHRFTMLCYFPDDQEGFPLYDKLIHREANQSVNVTVYLSCADPPAPKPCHPSCLSSWTLTRFLYARQLSAFSTPLSQIAGPSGNPKSQSPFKLCNAEPSPHEPDIPVSSENPQKIPVLSSLSFLLLFTSPGGPHDMAGFLLLGITNTLLSDRCLLVCDPHCA